MNQFASREMSMDEFGDHEAGGTRTERKFLKWKDEKTGEINVWLAALPYTLWRHNFQRVVKFEDKDGNQVEKIVMYTWNTYEEPEAWIKELKGQGYFAFTKSGGEIDPDDLENRKTPKYDPFWMFLEWLYKQYVLKNISWTDKIFTFEAADSKTQHLHLGGMLRMYPKNWASVKFKSDEEEKRVKREFNNEGIELREAFKENATINCKYMFLVVDHENPEAGIQMTIEAETLGNGIKKIFNDEKTRIAAKNPKMDKAEVSKLANPVKRVCFKWEFDNSKDFKDKYDVVDLGFDEIPAEIQEAFKSDPPDVSMMVRPGNVAFLLDIFKTHWCHEVTPPWKEIFAPGFARAKFLEEHYGLKKGSLTELSSGESEEDDEDEEEEETPSKASESEDLIQCEACGKDMPATANECPHCKAKYVEIPNSDGFVALQDQKCETCGKTWHAEELKCKACGTEYGFKDDAFIVTKKPEPKSEATQTPEVRTSARRRVAK